MQTGLTTMVLRKSQAQKTYTLHKVVDVSKVP